MEEVPHDREVAPETSPVPNPRSESRKIMPSLQPFGRPAKNNRAVAQVACHSEPQAEAPKRTLTEPMHDPKGRHASVDTPDKNRITIALSEQVPESFTHPGGGYHIDVAAQEIFSMSALLLDTENSLAVAIPSPEVLLPESGNRLRRNCHRKSTHPWKR